MRLSTILSIVALVALSAPAAGAATYVVTQSGLTFSPANLTAAAGDTVRWEWTTGIHTVTNGTGTGDPLVGTLFDASLNSANPTYIHVFTDAGEYPYFCRPHLLFGMTGTVTVQAASAVEQPAAARRPGLLANVPNPFNPRTEIRFVLPAAADVTVTVVDVAGHRVRTLAAGESRGPGEHRVAWHGDDDAGNRVAAGVYVAVLEAGSLRDTRPLVLVK